MRLLGNGSQGAVATGRPLAGHLRRRAAGRCAAAVIAGLCGPAGPAATAEGDARPFAVEAATADGYARDSDCAGCHASQQAGWMASHHRRAMAEATDETVLGDFDDATFVRDGRTVRFYKKDGRFTVGAVGPDGRRSAFEILYTFGAEPLQQYLVALPAGRLQAFTIAWDVAGRRWFDLQPGEDVAPNDPLHWTGRLFNWNSRCAACHSTDLRKGFDLAADRFRTTASEISVGCQACHGPGLGHVAWARAPAPPSAAPHMGFDADRSLREPSAQLAACAPCHSRRRRLTERAMPGEAFLDHFMPALLDEGAYYADGQILGEVYVYGSFVQSAMYRAGVKCTDCHDPHSGRLARQGNAVCTACHGEAPPARFAALRPGLYDSPDHHHHAPNTDGAQCVSCHMPARTYMVVDPRRDHSFRVPRPDLSARIATPNACATCHADRSNTWAAALIAEWAGPGTSPRPHYGEAIAAGRSGHPEAAQRLAELLRVGPDVPAIARATAAALLGRVASPAVLPDLTRALRDDDPLVRIGALRAFERIPVRIRLPVAGRLLSDPVRAVRIEAARILADTNRAALPPALRRVYDAASREYVASELASAELPQAHVNLGNHYRAVGRLDEAATSFRTGLRLAPDYVPALVNLADIHRARGADDEGERLLLRAAARDPDNPLVQFSLALTRIRLGRPDAALPSLRKAADGEPGNARYAYTYAVALSTGGNKSDAVAVLERAYPANPRNAAILSLLATLHRDLGQREAGLAFAEKLLALNPRDPAARALVRALRAR